MDEERMPGLDELVSAVDAWNLAMEAVVEAKSRSETSIRLAERQLKDALHGLTLRRWNQLQSGSASIRDSRASRDAHRAAKVKPEVLEAIAELQRVRATSDQELAEARSRLAAAAIHLAPFGRLAERITGPPREGAGAPGG